MQTTEKFLAELDKFILNYSDFNTENIALLGGLSGLIFYCFKVRNLSLNKKGLLFLDTLIDEITTKEIKDYPYAHGICGAMYVLNELKISGIIEDDLNDFLAPIEEYILNNILERDFQIDNKDFLYGIYGYLHYFASKPASTKARFSLEYIIDKLRGQALKTAQGNAGYYTNNYYNKNKIPKFKNTVAIETHRAINLGLAHGNLSVALIYHDILEKYPDYKELVTPIKHLANLYMFNFIEENLANDKSLFPIFKIEDHNYKIFNSLPFAWCYGDLSVAIFLYKTFLLTGNPKYKRVALLAAQREIDETKLTDDVDAYYCHGYVGIAAQFETLYSLTGNSFFKERMQSWNNKLIIRLEQELSKFNNAEEYFVQSLDILNGALGIGLFFNSNSLNWKALLLN